MIINIIFLVLLRAGASEVGCGGRLDDRLRFGRPDAGATARFEAAAAEKGEDVFDGSVPMPIGSSLVITNADFVLRFDVGSIAAQSKGIRRLFRDVVHRSRPRGRRGVREFGAALLDYERGPSIVAKFTSNLPLEIHEAHVLKAIFRAADHSSRLERVLVIHSHPEWAAPNDDPPMICPSPDDYHITRTIRAAWEALHPTGDVEVEGVVLPMHEGNEDVFFRYFPEGLVHRE